MKRLLASLIIVLVLFAAAGIAGFALVSSDRARVRVESELANWLDVSVRVGAAPRATIASGPGLVLRNVRLQSLDGAWSVDADRIDIQVDVYALLLGEVRMSAIAVSGARVRAASPAAPARLADAGRLGIEFRRLLKHPVSLSGGAVFFGEEDRPRWREVTLRATPNGAGATIRGSLTATDQAIEFGVSLADKAILAGEGSGRISISVAAPLASLRVDGEVRPAGSGRIEGKVEFSASDLRGLAARFGRELAGDAAFGAARLTGTGSVSLAGIDLDTASLELDGNVGEGRLGLDTGGDRARMDGTLAFERFDMSVYAREFGELLGVAAHGAPGGAWRRWPLQDVLSQFDLDLRLSATQLVLGPLSGGPGGLSLRLREGDLSLDLSETAVAGGTVEMAGRLKPDRESGLLQFSMKMIADNLAAETLPRPEALPEILSGRVGGRLERVGQGASVEEVLASASTMASIVLADARFRGGEPAALFQRLTGNGDTPEPGSGVFERIDIQGDVGEAAMRLDRVTAETAGHVLTASGRMSLPDMALSLRGYLTKRPVKAPGGEGPGDGSGTPGGAERDPQTPVLLRGTLGEPRLLPDLMRRDDAFRR
ncbi:hypothetical protein [Stappia sp.]|uniref:AsmA family protein n=1 Tax=Stappia sp. TaxID=1870903 RepID=UPI003A996705